MGHLSRRGLILGVAVVGICLVANGGGVAVIAIFTWLTGWIWRPFLRQRSLLMKVTTRSELLTRSSDTILFRIRSRLRDM